MSIIYIYIYIYIYIIYEDHHSVNIIYKIKSYTESATTVKYEYSSYIHTFRPPSSNPATAREPSGDRAQDRAQALSGTTMDFISKLPSMSHTYASKINIYTMCNTWHFRENRPL